MPEHPCSRLGVVSASEVRRGINLIPRPGGTPCNISLFEKRMGFGRHQNVIKTPYRKRLFKADNAIVKWAETSLRLPCVSLLRGFARRRGP